VVTRNLEAIYDVGTALRAFALIAARRPDATLTIAGEGPAEAQLRALAAQLEVSSRVAFCGRLDRPAMAALYRSADLMLNPSTVDNMPNSILEAYAAGVPVVSTDVGGIPYIARNEESALLVPPGDPAAMANAACRVLDDPSLAARLIEHGSAEASRYAWREVGPLWMQLYKALASQRQLALQASR
jgi:glycosyltransferase involved in cell wall biosynthesis